MITSPSLTIFDMAGTTIEDRGEVPAAFLSTLADCGITISPEEITQVRGASKRHAIRSLVGSRLRENSSAGEVLDAETEKIYLEFRRRLAHAYTTGGVRVVPGAGSVIYNLRARGIKVALTTGFDRDIATLLLSSIGWTRNTVDAVVCGDDVTNGRPAPDMILLAMKLTAVADASRVANIGDTALDLEAGARAGVRWNIGVLSGAHPREALERAPHTAIIQSIDELRF